MSFNYSPKIITEGLALYLDAANLRSYPGSGTVWTDLSRNLNNGSLINSPTFNSSNNGSIVLNGSSQFININNISSYAPGTGDFAIEWWQFGGNSSSFPRVFSIGTYTTGITLALSQEGGTLYYWINTSANTPGTAIGSIGTVLNVWSHFVVTRVSGVVRAYKNGTFLNVSSNNNNSARFDQSRFCTIGAESTNGTSGVANTFWGGRISLFKLYIGKGLIESEVNQNYNTTKTRFELI